MRRGHRSQRRPQPPRTRRWKPSVSATGAASPAANALLVCVVATADSAAIEIGTNENGMPMPISRRPGRRSPTYEPPVREGMKSGRLQIVLGNEKHVWRLVRLFAFADARGDVAA